MTNYFFNSFEVVFITYGVGAGLGMGILTLTNTAILPHYFIGRLSFATGISHTGAAIGMFIFAALNEFLVNEYGLQGAFLILSAISLNTIPLGLLLREPHFETKISKDKCGSLNDLCNDNISTSTVKSSGEPIFKSESKGERESLLDDYYKKKSQLAKNTESNISNEKSGSLNDFCKDKTSSSTVTHSGLDLLRNGYFVLLMLANILIIVSHFVIPTMLPEHIVLLGGSKKKGANTVVIIGVANVFSRLMLWNLKADSTKTLIVILSLSSIISGASLLFSIFYIEYWIYICLCITFGLTRGIYIILSVLLTVKIVGKENTHHAFGITFSIWGLGILIGLPSCGVLANITTAQFQYSIVFMCVGSAEVLAGGLFIIMYVMWKE